MIFKIAVCDDEQFWIEQITNAAKTVFDDICHYKIDTFTSGEELIEENKKEQYNLLFIDIEFPNGISGMEVAREIRETNKKSQFIFVSGHEVFALDAYYVEAIGYVVKPIKMGIFSRFCTKAYGICEEERRRGLQFETELEVKAHKSLITVYACDIVYVKREKNNTLIHTVEGIVCKTNLTIKEMVKLLGDTFVLIDKGIIINWKYAYNVCEGKVEIHYNNEVVKLEISRRKFNDVYKQFFQVLRER